MKIGVIAVLAFSLRGDGSCLVVSRSSVTAGELAGAYREFGAIPADRHILWAPVPGLTRWVRSAELGQLAARSGVNLSPMGDLCVQRKTAVFSEEQVVAALREQLPARAQIRVVDYLKLPVMSGRLAFERRAAARWGKADQALHWRGRVLDEDRRSVPFWALVQIQFERRVVRASRAIAANAVLTADDLSEVVERLSQVDTAPSATREEMIGREVSRRVNRDEVLNPAWLRPVPLVRSGQPVRVVAESGHARLGVDAHALASGHLGDTVLLRNDASGRTFRASVSGPGTAVVRMEIRSQ